MNYLTPQTIDICIIILGSAGAWFFAQLFKLFWLKKKTLKNALTTSGGMPSAHTATIIALVFLIFFYEGFTTTLALAVILATIVIRDSFGVRYAVGRNSHVLKRIATKKKDKEAVILEDGHTLEDVMVGAVVGMVVAFATYYFFFMI